MAPMEKNLCTGSGLITERYIAYLVARARAEVGLLRVEATYVDPAGKGRPFQLGAHDDSVIPGLVQLGSAVHAAGGLVSVELAHCGRQTNSRVTGMQPVAPSAVPCERSGGYMPRELTVGEIAEIVGRFVSAALRVREAGLDAVEIHGASGYLLNAFLSPFSNRRTDAYGGTPERRMRFPSEVVTAVRNAVGPDYPLLYRLCADEAIPGGLTVTQTASFAQELERLGVDLIDVSAGTYESILATQPPMEAPAGTLLQTAAAIKSAVSIPVATAGKLGNLEVAERALQDGVIDFVTIARGLHADAELLIKAKHGRLAEARRCIACAECGANLATGGPAFCAINPVSARETEFRAAISSQPRRVMIVGAGPAGLEAARAARLQGHAVEVFERGDRVGGRLQLARLAPGRADIGEPVELLERELQRLGVDVHLQTTVDLALIDRERPDVVVVATGARTTVRPVPGIDRPNVVTASEFLARRPQVGERSSTSIGGEAATSGTAIVVGGSWVGCNVAALLLQDHRCVTILATDENLASDYAKQPAMVLVDRITANHAATVRVKTTVEAISDDGLTVWDSVTGSREHLGAQTIVVVETLEADLDLTHRIRARFAGQIDVHPIGDCARPRKLQDALLEGAYVAQRL
jgi:2,4-dienoyl-CoA reductase-like NADH-dependent reductase (Old Yellow Enzyme family)/thioredoxin reductase